MNPSPQILNPTEILSLWILTPADPKPSFLTYAAKADLRDPAMPRAQNPYEMGSCLSYQSKGTLFLL